MADKGVPPSFLQRAVADMIKRMEEGGLEVPKFQKPMYSEFLEFGTDGFGMYGKHADRARELFTRGTANSQSSIKGREIFSCLHVLGARAPDGKVEVTCAECGHVSKAKMTPGTSIVTWNCNRKKDGNTEPLCNDCAEAWRIGK